MIYPCLSPVEFLCYGCRTYATLIHTDADGFGVGRMSSFGIEVVFKWINIFNKYVVIKFYVNLFLDCQPD
jgi:hypothetical protein